MSGKQGPGRITQHWTEAELAIVDRHIEAARGGKRGAVKQAAAACVCELAAKFPDRKRARSAVEAGIQRRRRLAGETQPALPWTEAELAILDRYAERLRGGKQPSVTQAAAACVRELAAKFPEAKRTRVAVVARFKERRRLAGDARPMRHWTEGELAVVDRYVESARGGERGSVKQAVTACVRELAKEFPEAKRTRVAVVVRFKERRRPAGDVRVVLRWTEAELAVLDRHIELVRGGKQPSVKQAVTACMRELAAKCPEVRRTRVAVVARFKERRRLVGDAPVGRRWTDAEREVLDRHVEAARGGKRGAMKQAVTACVRELASKCPEGNRTLIAVADAFKQRRRLTGDARVGRRWTDAEREVLDRHVEAARGGKRGAMKQAVTACVRELAKEFPDRKRARSAVESRFRKRRWLRGDARVVPPWTEAEQAIVDRYVESVRGGKRGAVKQAVTACTRELAEMCPDGKRTRGAVTDMFSDHRRRSGDARVVPPWTEAELAIVDRHIESARGGSRGAVARAVADCVRELARKLPEGKHTRAAVAGRLYTRLRPVGGRRFTPRWTEAELAVVDRHIELLHDGKHRFVDQAAAACMRELANTCPEGKRTGVAVRDRIRKRRKASGDNLRPTLWVEAELTVIDRFVRAYGEGRYIRLAGAASDCRVELDRLRRSRGNRTPRLVRRTEDQIARKFGTRRRELGISGLNSHWTDDELRTVRHYARAVAEGRYASCRAAVPDCCTALDRPRRPDLAANRVRPARSHHSVLLCLLREARSFRPARTSLHWTDAELKIVDRYVRRLMNGKLETMADAVRKCAVELGRKTGPDALKPGPGIRRSGLAINFCLYRRLHQAGRAGGDKAGWSPDECAIRDRMVRAWKRSRAKGRSWHRQEAAFRLQKRLRARGFERTLPACWAMAQDGTRPYPDRT